MSAALAVIPRSPVAAIKAAQAEAQALIRAELAEILRDFSAAAARAAELVAVETMHEGTRDALQRIANSTATQVETIHQISSRNVG